MSEMELFQRLGLALAIGLLIGLERGWRERDAAEGSRVAGIRTFALVGFGGGLAALLAG
ncbi:MAG TPA: MgtC/SapB family protein, partial [Dongiaceae bacterium]